MQIRLMLFISLFLVVRGTCVYAQTEKTVAVRWLQGMGCKAPGLRVTESYDELKVLEDAKAGAFVIVSSDAYSSGLTDRVLAYSTDNVFSNPEGGWSRNLIESYRGQLRYINKNKSAYVVCGTLGQGTVSPLLGKTRWGQSYPYNSMCPRSPLSNGNKLAGCVAVAVSQIMYYYHYPASGRGSFTYTMCGHSYTQDFSTVHPQWTKMKPSYGQVSTKGENVDDVAQLVSVNAVAVASAFGDTQTSSSALYARSAFVNFWGYAPSCTFDTDLTPSQLSSIAYSDVAASHPVILTGGNHAFVCDGYRNGYLHFNLGWNGAGNGYYRLYITTYWQKEKNENTVTVTGDSDMAGECSDIPDVAGSVLHGIMPETTGATYLVRSVYVPSAGMLGSVLGGDARKIKKLTISGKLNGTDIALLRRLMGASSAYGMNMERGVLAELDISSVDIVTDRRNPYLRMPVGECEYTIGKDTYRFPNVTDEQFRKFRKSVAGKGSYYSFVEEDGKYYVDFYLMSKTVGPMMFSDCQNLKKISLPQNTKAVLGRAFLQCNSMESITLPSSVKDVETGAFSQCMLLRRVMVDNPDIREVVYGLSPVKTFGFYGTLKDGKLRGLLDGNDPATCSGISILGTSGYTKVVELPHEEYAK